MAVRPKTANPSTTAPAPSYISAPGQLTSLKKPSRRPRNTRSTNHPLVAPKRHSAPRIDAVNPSKKDEQRLKELEKNIPSLNMIVPAGVVKPKSGKKKGKVFVEDKQTMVEILKLVNETREKVVESKLDRGRQLEALREERRKEQEERERARKEKLDSTKDSIRRKRKSGKDGEDASPAKSAKKKASDGKLKLTKKVSFR